MKKVVKVDKSTMPPSGQVVLANLSIRDPNNLKEFSEIDALGIWNEEDGTFTIKLKESELFYWFPVKEDGTVSKEMVTVIADKETLPKHEEQIVFETIYGETHEGFYDENEELFWDNGESISESFVDVVWWKHQE